MAACGRVLPAGSSGPRSADHRIAEEHGLTALYATAAEHFGVLRVALNTVSDSLFFPGAHTPERLMRQVRDEGRWKKS